MTKIRILNEDGQPLFGVGNTAFVTGYSAGEEIITRSLKVFLGEWFLNKTYGIPYNDPDYRQKNQLQFIDTAVYKMVIDIPKVEQILEYNSSYNDSNDRIDIFMRILYDGKELNININN